MKIANCQFPIADCRWKPTRASASIGNWQSAIGNPSRHRAFSLVEMMIAIIILGLGMVMVATMFPVAWDRARDLSEYTIEQTAVSAAQSLVESVVRPAGAALVRNDNYDPAAPTAPITVAKLNSGSLAGDLFYDPELTRKWLAVPGGAGQPDVFRAILLYSDTRVHALHMENVLSVGRKIVREEPWRLEYPVGASVSVDPERIVLAEEHPFMGGAFQAHFGPGFYDASTNPPRGGAFFVPQVSVSQRVQASLGSPPTDTAALDDWNDRLSNRRFCWAILHRLREPVGPRCEYQESPQCLKPYLPQLCGTPASPPAAPLTADESKCLASLAAQASGSTRNFDVYYVTLRRPQPTHRYARQDRTRVPDPYQTDSGMEPTPVAALGAEEDVILPIPWRVQVQVPNTLSYNASPTGVPTEITVPPPGIAGATAAMVVSMFPTGTQFVDEMTGMVLRVAKRRVLLDASGNQSAVLTLDRELVVEDVDVFQVGVERRIKCDSCTGSPGVPSNPPDEEDLRRTVWVFPPPVDRSSGDANVLFDGASPVVGIDVRTLSVAP